MQTFLHHKTVTILHDTVTTLWSADDICLLILNISCSSDILVLYVFSSTLPVLACYNDLTGNRAYSSSVVAAFTLTLSFVISLDRRHLSFKAFLRVNV